MAARIRSRSGMSLLEVVIAIAIFATAMGGLVMSFGTGGKAYSQTSAHNQLYVRTGRAMQRLLRALTPAATASLAPADPDGGDRLAFRTVVGALNGAPVLGNLNVITLELSASELDNGVDDDGNGLVDERVLVLRTDFGGADEKRIVLLRGVPELLEGEVDNGVDDNGNGLADEPGLSFDVEGGVLTIRLSAQTAVDQVRLVTETLETSIALRN